MTSTVSTAPSLAQAQAQLRRHGRSFFWAAHFLPRHRRHQAARLYSLCRQIDDLADDAVTAQDKASAAQQLQALQTAIDEENPAQSPLAYEALELCQNRPLSRYALSDLLSAVQSDLQPVQMAHWSDLLGYCYGVAGTVGVMMAELLEVRHPHRAMPHAIDLGIAMQLTNIARDVLEDARLGRVYLPADSAAGPVSPGALCQGDHQARERAWLGVKELLAEADRYYLSGWQGFAFIPSRPRLAIAVAARIYREIGLVILRGGPEGYWQDRARVSGGRKALLTFKSVLQPLPNPASVQHNASLHEGFTSCIERSRIQNNAPARTP